MEKKMYATSVEILEELERQGYKSPKQNTRRRKVSTTSRVLIEKFGTIEKKICYLGYVSTGFGSTSHRFYGHPFLQPLSISCKGKGKTIPQGTLKGIIRDIGISVADFNMIPV